VIEVLFYLSIMVLILLLVVQAVLLVGESRDRIAGSQTIERGAVLAMDRLNYFAREGYGSDWEEGDKELVFYLDDQGESKVRFYLEDDDRLYIDYLEEQHPLIPSDLTVDSFEVEELSTDVSRAVRIYLDLVYQGSQEQVSREFQTTVVLRNSYVE